MNIFKKLFPLLLIVVFSCESCKDDIFECLSPPRYAVNVPLDLSINSDTINVNDTIILSAKQKVLFDIHAGGSSIDLKYATFSIGIQAFRFLNYVDSVSQTNYLPSINSFEFSAADCQIENLPGTSTFPPSTNKIKYVHHDDYYQFTVRIIPKDTGTFLFSLNGGTATEPGKTNCEGNATLITFFTIQDVNEYIFNQYGMDPMPNGSKVRYAFVVR